MLSLICSSKSNLPPEDQLMSVSKVGVRRILLCEWKCVLFQYSICCFLQQHSALLTGLFHLFFSSWFFKINLLFIAVPFGFSWPMLNFWYLVLTLDCIIFPKARWRTSKILIEVKPIAELVRELWEYSTQGRKDNQELGWWAMMQQRAGPRSR